MEAKKCVCGNSPIFSSKEVDVGQGAIRKIWSYRHECNKTNQVFNGQDFETEETAIETWNKIETTPKLPSKDEPLIPDPLQLTVNVSIEALTLSRESKKAGGLGHIARADALMTMATLNYQRADFWYGIYIQKCYAEGMKPEKIFGLPIVPKSAN